MSKPTAWEIWEGRLAREGQDTSMLFETMQPCKVCAKAGGRCWSCFDNAPIVPTEEIKR